MQATAIDFFIIITHLCNKHTIWITFNEFCFCFRSKTLSPFPGYLIIVKQLLKRFICVFVIRLRSAECTYNLDFGRVFSLHSSLFTKCAIQFFFYFDLIQYLFDCYDFLAFRSWIIQHLLLYIEWQIKKKK